MIDAISRSRIVGFPDGNVLTLCPTMDLLMISMNKTSIWVFRYNGERIYSINNKSVILDFAWSPDGQFFCVSAMDGSCNVYVTNSGALVTSVPCGGTIDLIRWYHQPLPADDELFATDVLDAMPRAADFTNFKSLDYLAVSANSCLSFLFNNQIKFDVPVGFEFLANDNASLFRQFFLTANDMYQLQLVEFSLSSAVDVDHLQKLVLCLCKVKSALDAVQRHLEGLIAECAAFLSLFDRYLSNYYDNLTEGMDVKETVDQKCRRISKSLLETLLTGLVPAALADYWLNQFGDRGHKRLLKQGNSLYDAVRDVNFKHVVSLLERLIIVLTELGSHVDWNTVHAENGYGIDQKDVQTLLDHSKHQLQLTYNMIWASNEEQKRFLSFMDWTKYVIGSLNKEKNDEDITIKATHNTVELMEYFGQMFSSRVLEYLPVATSDYDILGVPQIPHDDLLSKHGYLQKFADEKLIYEFSKYFGSVFSKTDPIDLDLPAAEYVDLKLHADSGVVCTCAGSQINLVKFDMDFAVQRKSLTAATPIIDVKALANSIAVMVKHDASVHVGVYGYDDLLQSSSDQLADVKPQRSIAVTDINPKHMLINPNKDYTCLFDENKKDYIICKV